MLIQNIICLDTIEFIRSKEIVSSTELVFKFFENIAMLFFRILYYYYSLLFFLIFIDKSKVC